MPPLPILDRLSPTLATAIQRCGLAVALTIRARHDGGPASSSPSARLGNAAHRVLAWVALDRPQGDDLEDLIRTRWLEETRVEGNAAAQSHQERYLGDVARWPGFAMTQERLVIEALRFAVEVRDVEEELWVERPLVSSRHPLHGIPDLVRVGAGEAAIVDFKSGEVHPEDCAGDGRYATQVLLYAALVTEAGAEPIRAEIRPIGRPPVPISVSPTVIEGAVSAAVNLLDTYNTAVEQGHEPSLGRPGEAVCRFCPHLVSCPAVWRVPGPDLGDIVVLEGTINAVQTSRHGAVALRVADAHDPEFNVRITGLDSRRLPALSDVGEGQTVRLSGLRRAAPTADRRLLQAGPWVQLSTEPLGV